MQDTQDEMPNAARAGRIGCEFILAGEWQAVRETFLGVARFVWSRLDDPRDCSVIDSRDADFRVLKPTSQTWPLLTNFLAGLDNEMGSVSLSGPGVSLFAHRPANPTKFGDLFVELARSSDSVASIDDPATIVSWLATLPDTVVAIAGFSTEVQSTAWRTRSDGTAWLTSSPGINIPYLDFDFFDCADRGVPGYMTTWAPGDFQPVDDIPRRELPSEFIAHPPAFESEAATFESAARYEWDPAGPRADAFQVLFNPDEPAPFDGAVPVCFESSWDGADAVWQDIEDPGAINVAEVDSINVAELSRELWWDPEDDDLDGFWDGAPTWDGLTSLSNSPSAALPEPFGPLRVVWVDARRAADVPGVLGWPLPIGLVDLTAILRSWEDRFGARVAVMGVGVLWLIVERPPTERAQLERLACEIAAVCPNAAEQCHSFAGFVDTLAASDLWELFFD